MKEYIAIIAGLALAALTFTFQPVLGIVIWVALAALVSTGIDLRNRYKEDERLNGLIDDLYILTDNPETGDEPEIGRLKGKYIVVKHREVFEQAGKYRERLKRVKNPLYLGVDEDGDPLPEDERIEVKCIIYGHGEHVDELWEEYLQRAEDQMARERSARHGHHASNAHEWYIGAHHHQNSSHLKKGAQKKI